MSSTSPSRRDQGGRSEDAAVEYLERNGYRVLARNFSCRAGEVDIVAEKEEQICFVEVRSRANAVWGDPSATISRAKQRRVVRAALRFCFEHGIRDRMIRFDVASITGFGRAAALEYIPGAFEAEM